MSFIDEIPGYREAVEAENTRRDAAYLALPHEINGIPVYAFTPRHNLTLSAVRNPLATGGPITPAAIAMFLWVISSRFSLIPAARSRFIEEIAALDYSATVKAITEYLAEMFADAPASTTASATDSVYRPSYWSDTTDLVDLFAVEYSWPWQQVIDTPYPILWQQLRRITHRADPKTIHFNASDKVRSAWLRQINQQPSTQ